MLSFSYSMYFLVLFFNSILSSILLFCPWVLCHFWLCPLILSHSSTRSFQFIICVLCISPSILTPCFLLPSSLLLLASFLCVSYLSVFCHFLTKALFHALMLLSRYCWHSLDFWLFSMMYDGSNAVDEALQLGKI